MRFFAQVVSWIALAGTIVPALMYLAQKIDLDQATVALNAATIVWFIATPMWMGRERGAS